MPDVEKMLSDAREAMTVQRVFGEPYEHEGATLIPVAAIRGGGGGGGDAEHNGGGGFGLSATPVGVYLLREGEVAWRPAVNPNRIVLGWQVVSALAVLAAWSLGRRMRRR